MERAMHLFPWDETEEEAGARRFAGFIAWLLCLVALAVVLVTAGCATKPLPKCPNAGAVVLRTSDGTQFYAFTAEAVVMWTDAIRKEALGECEFKKGEPT